MSEDDPLAVYKRNANSIEGSFLLKETCEDYLNKAGTATYPNVNTNVKQSWTLHSVQIGATTLLYARFQNKELIKSQLRWALDKWREYIRYTPVLAGLHARALIDVDTDDKEPSYYYKKIYYLIKYIKLKE